MELSFLGPVCTRPGPWASVYLDASRDTQDARPALDLRWRALSERLAQQGADLDTIQALDAVVRGHVPLAGDYGLAAFASHGKVALSEYMSAPPVREIATYAPLPHTMPLVAQRGAQVAWVRVLAGRTGADVKGVSVGGVTRRARVKGSEQFPIRRVQPGGWSQSHFQREARMAWKRNAGDAAAATAELADRVGAEVVVVAGDNQARSLLAGQLPERWQDRIVQTDAGFRADGADLSAMDDVTVQAIAEVADQHTQTTLDRYGVQEDVGGGFDAVVAALQRGQVDTLLIVDDPSSTQRLWIGPEPTEIATSAEQLTAMSVPEPQQVRADAALIRALVGTDAAMTVLAPEEAPELDDGIGAVLRYVDAGTPGRGNT